MDSDSFSNSRTIVKLQETLFWLYGLFVLGSTFSIALAQSSLGLSLAVFLTIVIMTRHNPILPPLRLFFMSVGIFIAWELVSALLGQTPLKSAGMLKEEWLFAAIPIGIYVLKEQRNRNRIIIGFAVAIGIISIYAIIQHFTGVHWFKSSPLMPADDFGFRARGIFSHRLTFGNYYGAAALFLFGYGLTITDKSLRSRRTLLVTAATLAIIATVLSYSRGVIAGVVVALPLMGLLLGRRHFLRWSAILIVGLVLIWFTLPGLTGRFTSTLDRDFDTGYEGGRIFIWSNSTKIIKETPVFGVGPGNFRDAYVSHLPEDIDEKRKHSHAHNDFLNIGATSGIPAAVFYCLMWMIALRHFWAAHRHSQATNNSTGNLGLAALLGSLVFFAASMAESNFADEEVRQLLMFFWAAGLCYWLETIQSSRATNKT